MASVKRPVDAFRRILLHRLRENRGRGGWQDESIGYLLSRIIHNTISLVHRFHVKGDPTELLAYLESAAKAVEGTSFELLPEIEVEQIVGPEAKGDPIQVTVTRAQRAAICEDAADLANFAMMVADTQGDLRKAPWIEPPTKEETKELVDSMSKEEAPSDVTAG